MMAAQMKKTRKANFSQSETMALLECILERKHVIISSLGTDLSNKDKGNAWREIALIVSSAGMTSRTTDEVREKFYNLKRDHRTRVAARKKTGNGAVVTKPTDEIMDLIIGQDSELIEGVNGGGHDLFKRSQSATETRNATSTHLIPSFSADSPQSDNNKNQNVCAYTVHDMNTATIGSRKQVQVCDEGAVDLCSANMTISGTTQLRPPQPLASTPMKGLTGPKTGECRSSPFSILDPLSCTQAVQVQVHHPPPSVSWQSLDTSGALPQQQTNDDDDVLVIEDHQANGTAHEQSPCTAPVDHPQHPKRQDIPAEDKKMKARLLKSRIRETAESGESPLMSEYLKSCILLNQLKAEHVKLKILKLRKELADSNTST